MDFNAGKFSKAESIFTSELEMAKKLGNKQLKVASCNQLLDLFGAQLTLKPELASDTNFKARKARIEQEVAQCQKEEFEDLANLKKEIAGVASLPVAEKEEFCNRALELGFAYSEKGNHKESIQVLKEVSAIAEQTKNQVLIGKAHYMLGRAYASNRNIKEAYNAFATSLKIREAVLPKDDVDIARSAAGLASVSPPQDAATLLERARGIFSRAFSPNSHQVAFADVFMAEQALKSKHYQVAKQKAESAVSKCKNALESQLSVEEQVRAKQTLVRALEYRGLAKRGLLEAEKGSVPNRLERQAAISADFSEALKNAEELNPKPSAREIDTLIAFLLGEKAKAIKQEYEEAVSKSMNVPTDDQGHPLLLNEAKIKLARALAINERLPSAEMSLQAADFYFWMGRISRTMLDFPLAESYYKKAKEMSDRASGADSRSSSLIQLELDAVLRDSGQNKNK